MRNVLPEFGKPDRSELNAASIGNDLRAKTYAPRPGSTKAVPIPASVPGTSTGVIVQLSNATHTCVWTAVTMPRATYARNGRRDQPTSARETATRPIPTSGEVAELVNAPQPPQVKQVSRSHEILYVSSGAELRVLGSGRLAKPNLLPVFIPFMPSMPSIPSA